MKFTQKDMVLRHLENYGHITSKEAIDLYGITRLAGVVWELKHKYGVYNISSKMIPVPNRQGDTCYVAEYSLGE